MSEMITHPAAIFRRRRRIAAQRANRSAEILRARSAARRTCRRVVMLGESAVEVEAAPMWAPAKAKKVETDWRAVDRALRSIAKRRAALDAEEARWLREAEALQIWRPLGMVSMLDYLERVLGYGPRAAQDRLRVARALGTLPRLTAGLAQGELSFLGRARADARGDACHRGGVARGRDRQEPAPDRGARRRPSAGR